MSRKSRRQQLRKTGATKDVIQSAVAPIPVEEAQGGLSSYSSPANGLVLKSALAVWEICAICGLLVVMVFGVFGQTVNYGFVNYDDDKNVYASPEVTAGISLHGIAWAFTHTQADRWAPLTTISRQIDCQLYGLWAGGHHLTNVLLHASASVLLFLAVLELTGAVWRSGFVAAVFAVHPLRTECVAWVSARGELLCGVFAMLTLWAYARYARRPESMGGYAMVVICLALGLMSKAMLVTMPFVLLLIDYWPLARFESKSRIGSLLKEKVALFALSALSCLAAIFALKNSIQSFARVPLSMRLGNALVAYEVYLWKLVWPSRLAVLYPLVKGGWPVWQVIDATLLFAALTAGAYFLRRKQPYLLVGWLWYLGMLVPVIGIFQVGEQAYADRYTYLPQIGICLAATWATADWAGRRWYRLATLGAVASAILGLLAVAAYHQTTYWRNSESLWSHTIECTRDNFVARNDLGIVLCRQGRTEEAIAQFREALQIDPSFADTYNNLGLALSQEGRTEEAVARYREALKIDPADAHAHCNLGIALSRQGRTDEAIVQYRDALEINPALADAHRELGVALFQQGRTEDAIAKLGEALRLAPGDAEAHNNLGVVLCQQGRIDEGIQEYRQALRIDPALADAHGNLGAALLQQGHTDEALAEYEAALRLNPQDAKAHANLGNILLRQGRTNEAITQYREALRINPGDFETHYNLGNALLRNGETGEAISEIEKALELQPANPAIENTLAWLLAAGPELSLRNGPRAVQLAAQASQATGGDKPAILRTLAAAYAQAGQYSNAVQTAQKALQLAQSNAPLASALQREIKLYQAGQPFEGAH